MQTDVRKGDGQRTKMLLLGQAIINERGGENEKLGGFLEIGTSVVFPDYGCLEPPLSETSHFRPLNL